MKNAKSGFGKNLRYLCLAIIIALGLITFIAIGCGGGGGNDDTSYPGNPVGGVLLQGDSNGLASTAVYDYDSGDRFGSAEVVTDSSGAELVRTKIEIAFADTATIGDINALLASIGATITSMLEGVNLLVVRMADPGSLEELDHVISQLEADPNVRYVTKLYLSKPRELPSNYNVETSDLSPIGHHLAVRAHAAWNAREALNDSSSDPPLLVVEDYFGDGAPNQDFNVTSTWSDFVTGYPDPEGHGYHVLGIISAAYGGDSSIRGLATGICPSTLELRAADKTGMDSATSQNFMIRQIRSSSKNVLINSSIGFPDLTFGTLPSWCTNAARSWLEKVRGFVIYETGNTGPESLENRFLHFSSAGNIGQGPSGSDAALDSEYNLARLMPDLKTEKGVSLQNLTNTLVIENREYSTDQPYKSMCLNESSKYPGDLSAIGTWVFSLSGATSGTAVLTGTSMSSPQAAGLAAYVWALAPSLTPQELLSLLKTTARYSSLGCSPAPQSVIDAYSAILAVDNASALQEGGSPSDAKVRLAILDVVDADGNLGGNGAFDEKDLEYFLQEYSIESPEVDYSRCDLNGDGLTGGKGTDRFNLDIDYPATYGSVNQEILGQTVTFNERNVTDMQVLCYCAYSNLYTGDEAARNVAMEPVKDKCGANLIIYSHMPTDTWALDIYSMSDDGTNSKAITSWPSTYLETQGLAWSPEGDKIAVSLLIAGSFYHDIFVMNADGTGLTNITNTPDLSEVHPAWVGTKIAFSTYGGISVMDVSGSGRMDLPGIYYTPEQPSLSPDGTKVALGDRPYSSSLIHVWVYDFESEHYQDLGEGTSPAWSPDGKKIAFSGGLYLNEIWLMNPDGSGKTRIGTLSPETDYMINDITWSPDSERVAFDAIRWDADDYDIYVINVDGTGFRNITSHPDVYEQFPAWNP